MSGTVRPVTGLVTAGADPMLYLSGYGGPLEKLAGYPAHVEELGHVAQGLLGGVLMRVAPGAG